MEMEHTVADVFVMDEFRQSDHPSDLVYYDENGWWWYDETEMPDGPYDTRAEAATVCDNYCREVLGLEC